MRYRLNQGIGKGARNAPQDVAEGDQHEVTERGVFQASCVAGNDVQLAEGPPFSRVTGPLQFTEAGVQNISLNATVLGGQSRIETTRRADGEPIFTATGIATVRDFARRSAVAGVTGADGTTGVGARRSAGGSCRIT